MQVNSWWKRNQSVMAGRSAGLRPGVLRSLKHAGSETGASAPGGEILPPPLTDHVEAGRQGGGGIFLTLLPGMSKLTPSPIHGRSRTLE